MKGEEQLTVFPKLLNITRTQRNYRNYLVQKYFYFAQRVKPVTAFAILARF